jgi:hypothetical protein
MNINYIRIAGPVLLLALTAQAVVDMSGNGISDVYENQYGLTGQESAESDLDGDG